MQLITKKNSGLISQKRHSRIIKRDLVSSIKSHEFKNIFLGVIGWCKLDYQTNPILEWKCKVQYKKNLPYVYLLKNLSHKYSLRKGNEITCKLAIIEGKLTVLIELE